MTFCSPEKDMVSGLYMVTNNFYERDRIISPRRFVNRWCTGSSERRVLIL